MASKTRVDGRTRDTRDRIRQAATNLFFASGFSATTVREITAACSITPGALYNHYGSKDEVLVDIFAKTMEEIDGLVDLVTEEARSPSGELAMMALSVTYYHAEKRERGFVILNHANWLPPQKQQEFNDWLRLYRRRLERLLAEGVSTGEMVIPLDSELDEALAVTAKGLFDMWTQIGAWFRHDGPVSSRDIARIYACLALQAVSAPSQGPAIDSASEKHLAA